MLVSTQQTYAEKDIDGVVSSNISFNQQSTVDRLRAGINYDKKNRSVAAYEDDFAPRQLTPDEKRHILDTTLKLGNMLFYNGEEDESDFKFVHAYSLHYISISETTNFKIKKHNLFEKVYVG